MEQETNSIGEVYNWEYIPKKATSWDEANKKWDASGANQPWDTYGNEGGWKVSTARSMSVGEDTSSFLQRYTQDYVSVIDANLNNTGVVLNDVEFKDNGMTLTDIQTEANYGTPLEYEDARPLVPGEYTYEKAIIGMRLRTYNLSTKLGVYGAKLNVDVEDIISRGTVTVTSTTEPTVVTLNKFYYYPPEELMFNILNYSKPCRVKVLTKTTKEFTFMLESTEFPGEYVTGEVSWLATGY
jgi:hypothetical protein